MYGFFGATFVVWIQSSKDSGVIPARKYTKLAYCELLL